MLLKTNSLKEIILSDLISKGGEGEVFNIKQNKFSCAKIYHTQFRTKDREDKLKYMVANPPKELKGSTIKICWPEEILYENGDFIGFMMSKAFDHSKLPYHLCQPKIPKNLDANWHTVFARDTKAGKIARMKLCVNIAAAISRIHETKKYVLVDFKPQNILVSIDGKVSIIDLDSCQINEGSKLLFSAPVSTPEYTPVEASTVNFGLDIIKQSWDVFSFAVMMYEVLCGIHPFVGTANPPNDTFTTIQDKIKKGISHVLIGESKFQVLPSPHKEFNNLGKDLKELLSRAFGSEIKRPQIKDFGETCFKMIQNFNKHLEEENKRRIEADKKIAVQQFPVLKRENEKLKKEINQHKLNIENLRKKTSDKMQSKKSEKLGSGSNIGYVNIIIIITIIVCIVAIVKCTQNEKDLKNSEYRIDQIQESKESLKSQNRNLRNEISNWESEKNQLRNQVNELETKISNVPPLIIEKIELGSTKENGDVVVDYGGYLYDYQVYYLTPKIYGKIIKSGSVDLDIKIFDSKNVLKKGSNSPDGMSYRTNIYLSSGQNSISKTIGGWGNKNGGVYSSGYYRIEIWCENKILFSKEFYIN